VGAARRVVRNFRLPVRRVRVGRAEQLTEVPTAADLLIRRTYPIGKSVGALSRAERLARKFGLNIKSEPTRQILNSLDDTCESFISRFRKSSIRREFPKEFLNETIEDALESGNTTVRKLLTNGKYVK